MDREDHRGGEPFYVYCVDADFGPSFLKFCSYFPYNAKLFINGHHWAQQQAAKAGIEFVAMYNAFAAVEDVASQQGICDGLGPEQIDALLRKWLAILPRPFSTADRAAGYRYDVSVLQAEFSLTQMLDNPLSGRESFENVIRENLDIGRPDQVSLIFGRRLMKTWTPTNPRPFQNQGNQRRGHPQPARGLQARHDQAVPQGRTRPTNRDNN